MSTALIPELRVTSGRQRRRSVPRAFAGVVCAATLAMVGSSVADATTPPDDTSTGASASSAPAASTVTPVAVTLTESSLDGLPAEIAAGVVDVTVTDETEASGGELNFTLVEPGTDVEMFKSDLLSSVFAGGPFPDYFLNNAGVVGHSMITLDAGEYVAWYDLSSNLDRESTVEDIVTAPLTVGAGDDAAVIPGTDGGAIQAGDYLFDADVSAGGSTVTFTNTSDNQFHHVVVMDFGTNDPTVVDENFLAMMEAEGQGAMPEGIDPAQINFEFAFSGVFGPGGSGTFDAAFEGGHTYAAICFIQDRLGGQPHVFQHNMYEVFQL